MRCPDGGRRPPGQQRLRQRVPTSLVADEGEAPKPPAAPPAAALRLCPVVDVVRPGRGHQQSLPAPAHTRGGCFLACTPRWAARAGALETAPAPAPAVGGASEWRSPHAPALPSSTHGRNPLHTPHFPQSPPQRCLRAHPKHPPTDRRHTSRIGARRERWEVGVCCPCHGRHGHGFRLVSSPPEDSALRAGLECSPCAAPSTPSLPFSGPPRSPVRRWHMCTVPRGHGPERHQNSCSRARTHERTNACACIQTDSQTRNGYLHRPPR